MDDGKIIELYFSRDEGAIRATADKYGRLLTHISEGILASPPDAEECVNDTYLRAWESIPPTRPVSLSAYLARIVRNLSLNRYRADRARRASTADVILDELSECLPAPSGDPTEDLALRDALCRFVLSLPERDRIIFTRRYFYMSTVADIARELGMGQSSVKVILHRQRVRLRTYLETEDIQI